VLLHMPERLVIGGGGNEDTRSFNTGPGLGEDSGITNAILLGKRAATAHERRQSRPLD
jgi:hypothetical protein